MANRTSTLGFQVAPQPAPTVAYDDGGAAGLSNLGSTFLRLSTALGERADKGAAIRGADKGADVAVKFDLGQPPPLTKGTDAESIAFDRALQEGYAKRLELSTRQQAQKLAIEYPLDAAGYAGAMAEWSKGMKKNMPSNIQPGFDLTVQTLSAPHISAIAGVQRKQAEEGDKEVTALLAGQLLTDFRSYGRTLAGADSQDQAATSLEAAKLSFSTMIGGLNSAVVGGRMDRRAAAAQLLNFKGDMNASIVQGMFDGYKDKAGFLDAYQRGELRLPAVDIEQGADGQFTVAVKQNADPKVLLSTKQATDLRAYMNAAVDDIAQQRDRLRTDYDRVGSKSVEAQLAAIARGDQSQFDQLLKNPSAKAADIDKARDYLRQGDVPTNFATYRQLETAILQGHEFTPAQLAAAPLARDDRNRLQDLQKAQADYQAQPVFRDARDEIRMTVGGISQQIIAITGDEKGGVQKRQELAAKFEAQLSAEVNKRRMAAVQAGRGFGLARSPDGAVEWTYGNDGPVSFDPYAWVRQRIATVNERVKPTADQQKAIADEMRQNNAKMGQLRLRGDAASREQVQTLAARNAELVKQQVSSDAFLDALFSELN